MAITIIQNRQGGGSASGDGYIPPENTIVLWYGAAGAIPYGWSLYSAAASTLIMGASVGGSTITVSGETSHTHTIDAVTSAAGGHEHSINIATDSSGTVGTYPNAPAGNGSPDHSHSGTATSSYRSNHTHTTPALGSATNLPPYVRLYYIKRATSNLPRNSIIMWASGSHVGSTTHGIPEGWQICDGTNSTPNLVGKFVYAASSDGEMGATGGSATLLHSHASSTTTSDDLHNHSFSGTTGGGATGDKIWEFGDVGVASSGHTHSFSSSTYNEASHSHQVYETATSGSIPYVDLYYIMRVE